MKSFFELLSYWNYGIKRCSKFVCDAAKEHASNALGSFFKLFHLGDVMKTH